MEAMLKFIVLILIFATALAQSNYQTNSNIIPVFEFSCTTTGFFPYPNNRQKFYECVKSTANPNKLISYTYTCKPGECFDPTHQMKCSHAACLRINDEETEFTCLKEHLQQDAQITCKDETLEKLRKLKPDMVKFTAARGNAMENLMLSLRDVNMDMRQNYAKMIENTGKNVFPLMVYTDSEPGFSGTGGMLKIYFKDGSMRIVPVTYRFEMFKSLSHLVLAVFSILSPYFLNPNSINWEPPLRTLFQKCVNIEYLLNFGESGIATEERELALTIVKKTQTYIAKTIVDHNADMQLYREYANNLAPDIDKAMQIAAVAHAEGTIPALQKLREEMGETEWRKMYVIIPTVWPVSLYNIRLQALEKVMSFDQIKSQVLIVEGARSEDEAKTTLGRVIADRAVAQLVWGGWKEEHNSNMKDLMKDHVFSISTRRDLLSSTTANELNKVCHKLEQDPNIPDKQKCPFSGRSGGESPRTLNNDMPLFATMLRSR